MTNTRIKADRTTLDSVIKLIGIPTSKTSYSLTYNYRLSSQKIAEVRCKYRATIEIV